MLIILRTCADVVCLARGGGSHASRDVDIGLSALNEMMAPKVTNSIVRDRQPFLYPIQCQNICKWQPRLLHKKPAIGRINHPTMNCQADCFRFTQIIIGKWEKALTLAAVDIQNP